MASESRTGYAFTFLLEAQFTAPTIQKQAVGDETSRDDEAVRILKEVGLDAAGAQIFPVRDYGLVSEGCACACGQTSCLGSGTGRRPQQM
jgi:hypothetical protein